MPLELNYDIYNKKLLGIVIVLKKQKAFLQSIKELFMVKTDHKNLTSFLTIKELNQRQVRQTEMLTKYHFKIKHVKGSDNTRTDALSRKEELQRSNKVSGTLFKEDNNRKIRYNHSQLLKTYKAPQNLWKQQIKETQKTDSDYKDYKGRETQLEITYIPGKVTEEFVTEFYKGITQRHNRAIVLVARLGQEYIIRNIQKIAKKVTKECLDCQRNKFLKYKPFKRLQPVEMLSRPQKVILWDFIVKLLKLKDPVTKQLYNVILVIIDRLTKWGYFIACTEEILAEDVAQIYVKEVFS